MAEQLEIQVKAETGEAVANLGKTEKAVAGVTKETDKLDKSAKQASKSLSDAGAASKKSGGEIGSVAEGLNKTTSGFAKMMEATGKLSLIFGAAVAAGKALSAGLVALVDSISKAASAKQAAEARSIKFESALRLAQKGVIDLGHSTEQMLANYDAYVAKMHEATKATEEQARAVAEYQMTLQRLDEIVSSAKSRGFTIMSPEDMDKQFDAVRSLAKGLDDALGKAFKEGGAEERDKWAAANEEAVKMVLEAYKRIPDEIPANIKAIADAQNASAAAARQWSFEQAAAWEGSRAAAEAAGAAQRDHTTAVQQAQSANQDFGTSLDYVAQKVVENGGTLTAGAPIWLTVAQATDEATNSLLRYMEASRALREEQTAALEATKGWTDYVIALKEGFDSGVTSLYNYTTELQRFKTQLLQLFGAAQGEAKESLQAMIDLIQELIRTAGAGGSNRYDPSQAGRLEDAIRKSKEAA